MNSNTNTNTNINNRYAKQKIALGLCFYNKANEINRLLNSIPIGGIDVILAIDGAFPFICDLHKNDPNFCALSTDGSREILYAAGNRHHDGKQTQVIIDNCIANEFTKRNRYLELCEIMKCNYLLIVDSDEYFEVDEKNIGEWSNQWTKFREDFKQKVMLQHGDHNVYSIRTVVDLYGRVVNYPRAWYNPHEMRYHNNSHFKFKNYAKNEQYEDILDSQYSGGTIDHIVMKHDHNLRKNEDMKERQLYEDYLVKYEALVTRGIEPKSADIIARIKPAQHKDNCICFKCIDFKKIDVSKLVDPRKRVERVNDPFEKFRYTTKTNE